MINQRFSPDKNAVEEELIEEWMPVEGSRCDFQSSTRSLKYYIEHVILLKKGRYTGTIAEYKPFFHMFMFTIDNVKFNVYIPIEHAVTFATMLKYVISNSTINKVFATSVTQGWTIAQDQRDKSIIRKAFNKKVILEVMPYIEPVRKIPAFLFKWTNGTTTFDMVTTAGEISILIERLNGFINNAPVYNALIKQEIRDSYLETKLEKLDSLYAMLLENSKKVDEQSNRLDNFTSNIKQEISTAFSVAVGSLMAYFTNTQNHSNALMSQTNTLTGVLTENTIGIIHDSEKNTETESEHDNIPVEVEIDTEQSYVDASEIKETQTNEAGDDDLISTEFLSDEEIEREIQTMDKDAFLADLLKDEFNVIGASNSDVTKEDIKSIAQIEREELDKNDKGLHDDLAKKISLVKNKPVVENVQNFEKEIPLTEVYPTPLIELLTPELSDANVPHSTFPEEVKEYYSRINLKKIIETITKERPRLIDDSLLCNMLGNVFTKRNLSAMMINRGNVGIPATSVLYTASLFAAGYEEMYMTKDKNERKQIAFKYGRLAMKSFLELYSNKADTSIASKYHKALCEDIFKEQDEKYVWRLFVLDKMLAKDKYDYSYIDLPLSTLKPQEKYCLVKALTDIYLLLWYSEAKHIAIGSNTPGLNMVDAFTLINKPMYRFTRMLIVNIIASATTNEERNTLKLAVSESVVAFVKVLKVLNWDLEVYKDAVITLLGSISYINQSDIKNRPVDSDGFIEGTPIYAGIPYGDIYTIIKSTCDKIKERSS